MGELERSGQNTSAYCLAWTAIQRISRCPQQVLHPLCRILRWTESVSRTPHFSAMRSATASYALVCKYWESATARRRVPVLTYRVATTSGTDLNTCSPRTGCRNKR